MAFLGSVANKGLHEPIDRIPTRGTYLKNEIQRRQQAGKPYQGFQTQLDTYRANRNGGTVNAGNDMVNPKTGTVGNTTTPDITTLQANRKQLVNELKRRGGKAGAPGFAKQLRDLDMQIGGLRNAPAPTGDNSGTIPNNSGTTGSTGGQSNDTITPGDLNPDGSVPTDTSVQDVMSALFPALNLAITDQYKGSPTYQWAREQGNRGLNRRLAAMGLSGSGAELEAARQLEGQLGAEESKMLQSLSQQEADRLERLIQNESDRATRGQDSQWGRIMDVLRLQADQNPLEYIYGALNNSAELSKGQGKMLADYISKLYDRPTVGMGGGGGGGASVPPFIPPAASGSDYSNILPYLVLGNQSTKSGYGNVVGDVLSGLLSSFGGKS